MAETGPRQGNAAIFIDLENLFGGYAKDLGSVPLAAVVNQLRRIIRARGEESRTTAVRAYANWSRPEMRAYEDDLLAHGVEAVQVFSFTRSIKNAADIQLCVDALAEAQDRPWTDTFVIVSGDGGFVPLVRRLRQLNKHVIVASTNHAAAGTVNGLLASAADEYHVLKVAETRPAATARPAPAPDAQARPTLEEYRDEITSAVRHHPQMRVGAKVHTGWLGLHLRKKWPNATYKDFGSATLGAFVEKHCGLAVHRPVSAGTPSKAATPASDAAQPPALDRSAYVRKVRALFLNGEITAAAKEGRVHLSSVGTLVRQQIPGTTFSAVGYAKLTDLLSDAFVGTAWTLVRDDKATYATRRDLSSTGRTSRVSST